MKRLPPGANGIKIWRQTAVISNSSHRSLIHVEMGSDGHAGALRIESTGMPIDDLDILDDGTVLLTTHRSAVLRLRPNGEKRVISEHPVIRGNTACRMGVQPGDRGHLYVVGDGGIFFGAGGPPGIGRIRIR